jgi:Putative peptidoglycan binding domain
MKERKMTGSILKLFAGSAILAGALALLPASGFATVPVVNVARPQTAAETAGPPVSFADNAALRTGYSSESVPGTRETSALQRALNRDGARLKVDGVLNQPTMRALLNYQSAHGLQISGALDPATRGMLHLG